MNLTEAEELIKSLWSPEYLEVTGVTIRPNYGPPYVDYVVRINHPEWDGELKVYLEPRKNRYHLCIPDAKRGNSND